MFLKSIKLLNFKNFEDKELEFSKRLNCFIGSNGVGKTNLMDAVFYLALCKSNFVSDLQSIKQGTESFYVAGEFVNDKGLYQVSIAVNTGQKVR
ncbi:MAG: AAA family ATPase [Bacteroidales bacterium]|nr:AAA family ATPase [Bacteroidales bacterium]